MEIEDTPRDFLLPSRNLPNIYPFMRHSSYCICLMRIQAATWLQKQRLPPNYIFHVEGQIWSATRASKQAMGNYISCASSRVPSNAVKVMHMDGRVEQFQRRIKAAELMLENSQQFVCHSNSLHIGRRITPLSADEDLEMGNLYFLVPMHKLHSALSGSDMASLALKANSAMKRPSERTRRVLPVFGDSRAGPPETIDKLCGESSRGSAAQASAVPRLQLDDLPDLSVAFATQRLGTCRSWKPRLETINEAGLLKGSSG